MNLNDICSFVHVKEKQNETVRKTERKKDWYKLYHWQSPLAKMMTPNVRTKAHRRV